MNVTDGNYSSVFPLVWQSNTTSYEYCSPGIHANERQIMMNTHDLWYLSTTPAYGQDNDYKVDKIIVLFEG
jgi:hypothetical protein